MLGGELTPTLHRRLARWGTLLPFGRAAAELADSTGVVVAEATARRVTEAAGAAYVAVQTAEAERLARETPEAPAGPAVQVVSVDGAMVPLLGGTWGEVKTLAIGTVVPDPADPGGVRTTAISYFSRRAEVEAFVRLALVETHRRGVERAGLVELLADGSPWCQQVGDGHRPDAVRVLDFGHAVGHLSTAAEATFGIATTTARAWVATQAHTLKHDDPAEVLAALRALPVADAGDPGAAAARDATLGYLETRWAQIQYAAFRARGLPIGSGMVESANKLVVEARLKGPGMHWAEVHVDPLVALRTALANDRWDEAWGQVAGELRNRRQDRTAARRAARRVPPLAPPAPATPPADPLLWEDDRCAPAPPTLPVSRPKLVVNGRPTAAHPWKRRPCPPVDPSPLPSHPKL